MTHPATCRLRHYSAPWAFLFVLLAVCPALATDYYISPTGQDANPGTSVASPWRTVQRVNSHRFFPGDRILFEGGRTFTGNLYFDASDAGNADAPVTVGVFGSGRATLDAQDGTGILAYNAAGFRIENLNVIGSGSDINTGQGIFFYNDLPRDVKLDFIQIHNVDVRRFGEYGILIGANSGASGFRNVAITRVNSGENRMGGVFTYAALPNVHEDVYVGYSSVFQNSGAWGLLYNSGNGIVLSGVNRGTVEHSVARENGWRSDAGNGPVGIWAYNSTRILLQFNESHHNRTGGQKDGGGFCFDRNTSFSVMQFNYSHDNAGAGYLLAHRPDNYAHTNNVIRYNVSENDGRMNAYGAIHTWGRVRNAEIHNNTVYLADRGTATEVPRGIFVRNTSITLQDPEGLHVRNNIVQTTGGVRLIDVDATALDSAVDLRFEGNAYYTTGGAFNIRWGSVLYNSLEAWRSATGQERLGSRTTGLLVEPRHVAPAQGATFDDTAMLPGLYGYRLRADSPLIDAGLDLRALGVDPGTRDYFGGIVPYNYGPMDIGAHEYGGECAWSLSPSTSSAAAAGGDASLNVGTTNAPCGWAAQSRASWIAVTSGSAGMSGGTVGYRVAANSTGTTRTGTIRIADQTFTVTQPSSGGSAPAPALPTGWQAQDIGGVGPSGSATASGATVTVRGGGADIWGAADALHFAWTQLSGDITVVARVASVEYVHAWTKAGVMIRERLTADSPHALMLVSPAKGLAFQRRLAAGGLSTSTSGGLGTAPAWVRLERRGNVITAARSTNGTDWSVVGSDTFAMGAQVYVGLAVTSHDPARLATATFDSVAISTPVPDEPAPPPPPAPALPAPWQGQDVGAVGPAGRAVASNGVFTLQGSGADIWGPADAFQFAWQRLSGNGDVIARVTSVEYVHAWVKAGVMIRERLTGDSAHALMLVSPGKGLAFQRRVAAGGLSTHTTGGAGTAPMWVKLERRGNTITAFASDNGTAWRAVGSDTVSMPADVYVGLVVSSHDNTRLAAATFANVSVTAR